MQNNNARPHWFHGIGPFTTAEELKRQYRRLVMEHHPDRGGTNEDMAAINAEYAELARRYGHIHETAEGSTYESSEVERPEEFIELLDILARMEGVDVEVIGRFVWASGETYAHKDELKEAGFRWSRKRQKWYWAHDDGHKHRGSRLTMDEIRALYGVRYSHEGAPVSNRLSA